MDSFWVHVACCIYQLEGLSCANLALKNIEYLSHAHSHGHTHHHCQLFGKHKISKMYLPYWDILNEINATIFLWGLSP